MVVMWGGKWFIPVPGPRTKYGPTQFLSCESSRWTEEGEPRLCAMKANEKHRESAVDGHKSAAPVPNLQGKTK